MTETTTETKRNRIAKKSYDDDGYRVTFTFSDGQNVTIDPRDFSAEMQSRLLQYGVGQKFGDSYAGSKSPSEGLEEINTMVAQINAGQWHATREGGAGPKSGKTVRALFRIGQADKKMAKGISAKFGVVGDWTLESVRDMFAGLDKDTKKAISGSNNVKQELAAMAMEESTTGADLLA